MDRIIGYARARGLSAIVGRVLRENQRMIDLCRQLGFALAPAEGEAAVLDVRLDL